MPPAQRAKWIQNLNQSDASALEYLWGFWARPAQLSPWSPVRGPEARAKALAAVGTSLVIAGRGFGKSRIGAEATIEEAKELREQFCGALVARTAADIRDTLIEGDSGVLARSPPDFRPIWEPSKRRLTWPNGARAVTFTADEPDQLRGPNRNWAWADELAAWRFPDAYDQLQLVLRLNPYPRQVITTTPRPTRLIRDLLADDRTEIVRGSTYDNAENLAPSFVAKMRRKYEGTTLGRQEIHAEVMDEAPGALWRRALFHTIDARELPELDRKIVAIDPSATANDDSDEAGIIVAGRAMVGGVLHGYILRDYSGRLRPQEWATRGVQVYDLHQLGRVVAEVNHGGDMVEDLVRSAAREMQRAGVREGAEVAYHAVRASEGKRTRAEPIVALYEQGRIHHVANVRGIDGPGISTGLSDLEDQMCTWVPGQKSPDRMDAAVWALTDLILDAEEQDSPSLSINYASQYRPNPWRGT